MIFWVLFSTFFTAFNLSAQGWERHYDRGACNDAMNTPDGGFLLAGEAEIPFGTLAAEIIKTSADGTREWRKYYEVADTFEYISRIAPMNNQFFLAAGDYSRQISSTTVSPFVYKLNAAGDVAAQFLAPTANGSTYVADVCTLPNGNVLLAYRYPNANTCVLKVFDDNLVPLWSANFPAIDKVIPLADGTMLVYGDFQNSNSSILARLDANANIIWQQQYTGFGGAMNLLADGNIVVALHETYTQCQLRKLNLDGVELWAKSIQSQPIYSISQVIEDQLGNILVVGSTNANFQTAFNVLKTDASGNLIFQRIPHISIPWVSSTATPMICANGEYAFAGTIQYLGNGSNKMYLMRCTDEINVYKSWIAGSMYHDKNDDCQKNGDEKGQKYFYAIANDANGSEWVSSIDADGKYAFQVPTGNYMVQISKRTYDPDIWMPCPAENAIVTANTDTIHVPPMGVKSLADGPKMQVIAQSAGFRPCLPGAYTVHYWNLGTEKATDVFVEVELPDVLTYTGSSIAPASQNGQNLVFNLGDVDVDGEGIFKIDVLTSCNAQLGDLACGTFHIQPDTALALTGWDKSIVQISATCNTDDLTFTLKNVGEGDMSVPRTYNIYRNCFIQLDAGTFQLDAGEEWTKTVPNTAGFFLFWAERSLLQPYTPGSELFMKGCGTPNEEQQWTHNTTGTPSYSLPCKTISNSLDPNAIEVSPHGYGEEGKILNTEPELDYVVHFQNTGNDTAYQVVIRDTLPVWLNVETVAPGAGSHPFTVDLKNRVLTFTFSNIMLPDSNVNELASHGFADFKVKMLPGLTPGTRIENKASIYFDFNEPVHTNTALNTIVAPLVRVETPENAAFKVQVAPNPTDDFAVFTFENDVEEAQFSLYDTTGKLLREETVQGSSWMFRKNNLPEGIYIYHLTIPGKMAVSGKIIIQ